jgi:hypothetical protein
MQLGSYGFDRHRDRGFLPTALRRCDPVGISRTPRKHGSPRSAPATSRRRRRLGFCTRRAAGTSAPMAAIRGIAFEPLNSTGCGPSMSTAKRPSMTLGCRRTNREAANRGNPAFFVPVLLSPGDKADVSDSLTVCFGALALAQAIDRDGNTGLWQGTTPKNCEDREPRGPDTPNHRDDRGDLPRSRATRSS